MTQNRPDASFIESIPRSKLSFTIIGGGSLGSGIAGALRTQEFLGDISVIDFDHWEPRNRFNNIWPNSKGPKASSPELDGRIEALIKDGELDLKPDILICATDSIESRITSLKSFDPSILALDMRAGEHGCEITLGDTSFVLGRLPNPQLTEEMSCQARGSIGHTLTIVGLAMSRLTYALMRHFQDDCPILNESFQASFFGEQPAITTLKRRELPMSVLS
jgi:hypothetical protein